MIRVAILAPALALRIGLHEVLRGLPDVEMLADSALPQELPQADVWVVTSADFIDELNEEQTPPLLLLTGNPDEAARLAGWPVWGILPLEASAEEFSAVLHALAEGLWAGSPALVQGLLERHRLPMLAEAEQVVDPLTERERQVLQLTAQGLANKQIAASLEISENTVKFHLSSLYAKLGVTSRTEAVRAGARRGWVVL
ncbi:MAG: response regulator transcription factor [Anaerolineales bacterium]